VENGSTRGTIDSRDLGVHLVDETEKGAADRDLPRRERGKSLTGRDGWDERQGDAA